MANINSKKSINKNTRKNKKKRKTKKICIKKSASNRGAFKAMAQKSNYGNMSVNNKPHRNDLGNNPGLLIWETSTEQGLRKKEKDLIDEMELQRTLSEKGLAPRINNNFVEIKKRNGIKNTLKAFYVERMIPIDKYNFKNDTEILSILNSFMKNLKKLISELGYINIDMKEENLVLSIKNINGKKNRLIETLFIDTSPDFFIKIIDPLKKDITTNNIKKYAPFISLLQILFVNNINFLLNIKNNLYNIYYSNNDEYINPHFELIINFVKKYISENDIKKEMVYEYLSIINRLTVDYPEDIFSLYYMILYYCFPDEDRDILYSISKYNNNNNKNNKNKNSEKKDALEIDDKYIRDMLSPLLDTIFDY